MDSTDSVINSRLSVSEAETGQTMGSTNAGISSELGTSQVQSHESSVSPGSPTPAEAESRDIVSEPHLSAPTPPPTALRTEVLEHAYWAEFDEDTTTPEEDELKEIEGADTDYSADDRRCKP